MFQIIAILKSIARCIGYVIGFIDSQKADILIKMLLREYHSGRTLSRFLKVGKDVILAPGISLIHPERIMIGDHSSIMKNCILEVVSVEGKIIIGSNISLGEYSHITAANNVTIDDGVVTGRFVLITDNAHGNFQLDVLKKHPLQRPVFSKGCVKIGKNVWIGDKVTILPGVKIGEGAVIGANSVVTKDIPEYSLAVGNPARIIKRS